MKKTLILISMLFIYELTQAQYFFFRDSVAPVAFVQQSKTETTGYFGGFSVPRMSNTHLNDDGIIDLFVFDRGNRKVLTFLGNGDKNNPQFTYAPQYEVFFPTIKNWALLADLNCDGLDDVICGNGNRGAAIYFRQSKDLSKGFKRITDEFEYYDRSYKTKLNLTVEGGDVPIVDDIDGDGDLDILAFDQDGAKMLYCQNRQVEENSDCDKLNFQLETNCWGMFFEDGGSSGLFHLKDCANDTWKKGKHVGSNALAIDMDGDGDKELLLSDVGKRYASILYNGKFRQGQPQYPKDSIISWDSHFPLNPDSISIDAFPAMFYLDLDFDGVKDLYVAPGEEGNVLAANSWFYHNAGTNNKPDFQLKTKSFLKQKNIDLGRKTFPLPFDEDGDGDYDLLLAVEGNSGYYGLQLFRNTGTTKNPIFELANTDYLNLGQYKLEGHCALASGDIDNNGTLDLIIGKLNGELLLFANANQPSKPVIFSLKAGFLDKIQAWGYAAPFVHDVDADGKNDLLIGNDTGQVEFWKSTGSGFVKNDANFGNIWVGESMFSDQVTLAVTQLDSNQLPDLVVAGDGGSVRIYYNFDHKKSAFDATFSNFYNPGLWQDTTDKFLGFYIKMALADLNGDGLQDLVLGSGRGGVNFYAGTHAFNVSAPRPEWVHQLKVYPNPAKEFLAVEFSHNTVGTFELELYDLLGKKVLEQKARAGSVHRIDLLLIPKGYYTLVLKDADGTTAACKVLID